MTPVGNTAADTWAGLIAGRSGIARITRFDASGCTAQIAGEVKNFEPAKALATPLFPRGPGGEPVAAAFNGKDLKKFGRFTHLGTVAAVEAYADSGLDAHRASLDANRMGVNLGVLPTKGLTLPLMSYGGSGVLINCIGLTLLLRIDYENRVMMRGGRP